MICDLDAVYRIEIRKLMDEEQARSKQKDYNSNEGGVPV